MNSSTREEQLQDGASPTSHSKSEDLIESYLKPLYVPDNSLGPVESLLLERGICGRVFTVDELTAFSHFDALLCGTIGRIIAFAQEFYRVSASIRVCLVELDDTENAFASLLKSGEYVIVFFTGLFGRVARYSLQMVRTKPIVDLLALKTIASLIDRDNKKEFSRMPDGLPKLDGLGNTDFENAFPLATGMVCATAMHEVAHVVNGHLLLISKLASGELAESKEVWLDRERIKTIEALEFDADCLSVSGLIAFLGGGKDIPEAFRDYVATRDSVFRFTLLSSSAIFLYDDLFFSRDLSWATVPSSHSTARLRSLTVIATLARVLKDRHGYEAERAFDLLMPVHMAIMACSVLLRDTPTDDASSILERENKAHDAYRERILGRWAKLRPLLEPLKLSRGKLAPAQYPPT